jgi:hypothetical protein
MHGAGTLSALLCSVSPKEMRPDTSFSILVSAFRICSFMEIFNYICLACQSPMTADFRLAQSLTEELTICELLGMSLVRASLLLVKRYVNLVFRSMI